jgi:hypothetical protein
LASAVLRRYGAARVTVSHNCGMLVIGIDLAWSVGSGVRLANETGLVAVEPTGGIVDAGWEFGPTAVVRWIDQRATNNTLLLVDSPLVVLNIAHQRLCESRSARKPQRGAVRDQEGNPIRLRGISQRTSPA